MTSFTTNNIPDSLKSNVHMLWDPIVSLFKCQASCGNIFKQNKIGFKSNNSYILFPEEGYYMSMIGKGNIIRKPDQIVTSNMDIVRLLYIETKMTQPNLQTYCSSLDVLNVYLFVRRKGYHLRRCAIQATRSHLENVSEHPYKKMKTCEDDSHSAIDECGMAMMELYITNQAYENSQPSGLICIQNEHLITQPLKWMQKLQVFHAKYSKVYLVLAQQGQCVFLDVNII